MHMMGQTLTMGRSICDNLGLEKDYLRLVANAAPNDTHTQTQCRSLFADLELSDSEPPADDRLVLMLKKL
jgi:hypothetical protein